MGGRARPGSEMATGTKPLRALVAPSAALPADVAASGPAVPPIVRLRHMSANEWEDFIFEWAHSLKTKYTRVEQCGGAGDMGRDVVAYESAQVEDPWDNYQCKHYATALSPGVIWLELGKLAYYTFIGEYSVPRRYVFVAPRGAGTSLSKLFRRPGTLRDSLVAEWDDKCKTQITSLKRVPLDGALRKHVDAIDFSIFEAASPLTIIEEHSRTRWHVARFGGGLPVRQDPAPPPTVVATHEVNYVRALLDAYEDRLETALTSVHDMSNADLTDHFSRSRQEFYSAESLREFSRDSVPPGTFERFLDEMHSGIADVIQSTHSDSFERVLATVKHAKSLQLTANTLVTRTNAADRGGMCHQLANDLRVRWRR
jgi:hypothetical protein